MSWTETTAIYQQNNYNNKNNCNSNQAPRESERERGVKQKYKVNNKCYRLSVWFSKLKYIEIVYLIN